MKNLKPPTEKGHLQTQIYLPEETIPGREEIPRSTIPGRYTIILPEETFLVEQPTYLPEGEYLVETKFLEDKYLEESKLKFLEEQFLEDNSPIRSQTRLDTLPHERSKTKITLKELTSTLQQIEFIHKQKPLIESSKLNPHEYSNPFFPDTEVTHSPVKTKKTKTKAI